VTKLASLRRSVAASPRRTDGVVAAALAAISVAQVLVFPIAPRALGVAVRSSARSRSPFAGRTRSRRRWSA
jgi:hypothetical protein